VQGAYIVQERIVEIGRTAVYKEQKEQGQYGEINMRPPEI